MTLRQGSLQLAPAEAAKKCILVVEDELLVRLLLSDALRDEGYRVVEACNADEALAILDATPPDLIITDVRMPGSIDGLGLLALVREILPSLPVIITSGHLQAAQALAQGAALFVAKPFTVEVVLEAVHVELAKRQ